MSAYAGSVRTCDFCGRQENDTATLEPVETATAEVTGTLVEEELLVEEISIDGMCGVY